MISQKIKTLFMISVFFSAIILSFSACNKGEEYGEGEVTFEITDAPIDNPEVKAVFVTVTDVKVDGKSFAGFNGPKTIDLLALQDGKAEVLANGNLEARSYSNLTLELDLQKDENGNSPGCYVLTDEGKKQISSSGEAVASITSKGNFMINEASNKYVIDFDLRKAINSETSGEGTSYDFVSQSNFEKAVRVVNKTNTGTIKGSCENNTQSNADSYIVAYAYKKGEFNADAEMQGEVLFKNAKNSSLVGRSSSNGEFVLAFLEEGDYEVHFARYSKNPDSNNGSFELETMLDIETTGNASLNNIKVGAGANVNLALSIKGILSI